MSHPPLRVAWLLQSFPADSESFVYDEIHAMGQALGTTPLAYALQAPPKGRTAKHAASERIRSMVSFVPRGSRIRPELGRRQDSNPPLSWKERARGRWLAAQLRREGVDLLRCHFANDSLRIGVFAASLVDIPISLCLHARGLYVPPPWLDAALFAVGDIQVVSRFAAEQHPIVREHARFQPLGLSLPLYAVPGEAPDSLCCVARFVEKKGHPVLLRALARLPNHRLECFGAGPELDRCRELAAQLGLQARVVFHGAVTREACLVGMGRARVFVLPCLVAGDGDRDAMPVAMLEALALGRPVVVSPVGDLPRLLADIPGIVWVGGTDADGWADAIHRASAVTDAELQRASALVRKRHSWRTQAPVLKRAFEELIAHNRRSRSTVVAKE